MDGSRTDPIQYCRTELLTTLDAIEQSSGNLNSYRNSARLVIRNLESVNLIQTPIGAQQLPWFVANLQHVAYLDPDSGGIRDVAEWCVEQWLRLLQIDPQMLEALRGKDHLRRDLGVILFRL